MEYKNNIRNMSGECCCRPSTSGATTAGLQPRTPHYWPGMSGGMTGVMIQSLSMKAEPRGGR